MILDAGLSLSCNYLLEPKTGLDIPEEVLSTAQQINLLSFKPSGKLSEMGKVKLRGAIEGLKARIPVTMDNCLGVQLGFTKRCEAGVSFVHILPNLEIVSCCFKGKCFLNKENYGK